MRRGYSLVGDPSWPVRDVETSPVNRLAGPSIELTGLWLNLFNRSDSRVAAVC